MAAARWGSFSSPFVRVGVSGIQSRPNLDVPVPSCIPVPSDFSPQDTKALRSGPANRYAFLGYLRVFVVNASDACVPGASQSIPSQYFCAVPGFLSRPTGPAFVSRPGLPGILRLP